MARLLSVIEAVSRASMEIGITQTPVSQAIGSADEDVAQMVALLSAVADEVLDDQPYRETLGDGMWIIDSQTGATTDTPKADSDQILFDGRLAVNGLKFRFLQAKGLEFGEPMRDFAVRINKLAARANGRVLDLEADSEGGRLQ